MAGRRATPGEPLLAEARRAAIVEMLRTSGSVSVAEVQTELGVSPMTARRDLAEISRRGIARRTHGGAVMPSIAAHEDSFSTRLGLETDAKAALADAAVELLQPHDAIFIDSSTSGYFLARRIVESSLELTLITNSLPIMQLVAQHAAPSTELVAIGGLLRTLTQSFVGPHAIHTVSGHFTDRAFVSVKALSASGVLTDVDPLEAEVKRAMIAQAGEAVLLVDQSKLTSRGLNAVAPLSDVSLVVACGVDDDELQVLRRFDVPVRHVGERSRPGDARARPNGP
jgi:DeoR/GlpR family transcriptional regulator of sugar metabolism